MLDAPSKNEYGECTLRWTKPGTHSVHDALQEPLTPAAVAVKVTEQAVRGTQRQVLARDAVGPPFAVHAPAPDDLDDDEPPVADAQRAGLTLVPLHMRRQRLGEQATHWT